MGKSACLSVAGSSGLRRSRVPDKPGRSTTSSNQLVFRNVYILPLPMICPSLSYSLSLNLLVSLRAIGQYVCGKKTLLCSASKALPMGVRSWGRYPPYNPGPWEQHVVQGLRHAAAASLQHLQAGGATHARRIHAAPIHKTCLSRGRQLGAQTQHVPVCRTTAAENTSASWRQCWRTHEGDGGRTAEDRRRRRCKPTQNLHSLTLSQAGCFKTGEGGGEQAGLERQAGLFCTPLDHPRHCAF